MEATKQFSIRMPKSCWVFLRNSSTTKEKSMNDIMVEYIKKAMKKQENKVDIR